MAKLLNALAKTGLEITKISPTETARYTMTENAGQKTENKTELFSPLDIVAQIRANGRKGLPASSATRAFGEMEPEAALFETTMDPDKRRLLKVNIEDAAKASRRAVHPAHGRRSPPPRRQFIEDNAAERAIPGRVTSAK